MFYHGRGHRLLPGSALHLRNSYLGLSGRLVIRHLGLEVLEEEVIAEVDRDGRDGGERLLHVLGAGDVDRAPVVAVNVDRTVLVELRREGATARRCEASG